MRSGLLPVLGLSAAGLLLAGGTALAVGRLGRGERLARWMPVIGGVGLLLAGMLPFGWIAVLGRP